jgi:hypothetical protein
MSFTHGATAPLNINDSKERPNNVTARDTDSTFASVENLEQLIQLLAMVQHQRTNKQNQRNRSK